MLDLTSRTYSKVAIQEMELAECGDLYHVSQKGAFSESICKRIFIDLLASLKFIHDKGVCHRDLKLENVVIDKNCKIKLTDFGYATSTKNEDGDTVLTKVCGSPHYMAPEIYNKNYRGE